MKRWLTAIVLLIVVAGIAFYLSRSTHEVRPVEETRKGLPGPSGPETRIQSPPTVQNPPEIIVSDTSPAPVSATASAAPWAPGVSLSTTGTAPQQSVSPTLQLPAATVMENMRTAIRDYGSMFGGNPVGNNAEITRALNGENPKQAKFISPDSGLRINGKGELIDPWGTPLFFHQLSGNETEIRSAGPDKAMWTADDLIIK